MKKMWICALCSAMFLTIFNLAYGAGHKEAIETNDMPTRAQQFMKAHFGKATLYAYRDDDKFKVKTSTYQEVEFDKNGRWEEIENTRHQSLPASVIALLPAPAHSYMTAHFPGGIIYEIKRDDKGYVVKMEGEKVKIRFDPQGNYVKHKSLK